MKKVEITDREKLKLLQGKDWWQTHDLNGKLHTIKVSDGPVGLRCLSVTDSWANASIYPAVAYPCYQMVSQTWDLDLAYKMGTAIADDCIDLKVDVILGPGVNIKRTPLCGRNFEYFSEDPYVAGMFGKAFIEGVQDNHIGTSLKHYCCNNREFSRHWLSSEVDERTLNEIYLKPFEIAVKAKPWTIMSSYNLVNGVRMSEHKKLYKHLREKLGFEGVIVSDWEATKDPLASLHAGLDIGMPYLPQNEKALEEHFDKGEVDLDCLNQSAERLIHMVENAAEEKKLQKINMTVEERIALSQEIEEAGIVLLENDGTLPLKGGKICVTGAPAHMYYHGGGSSAVIPNRPFKPLAETLTDLGYDAFYTESIGEIHGGLTGMGNIRQACVDSDKSDVTILTVGTGEGGEIESTDRHDISLTREELEAMYFLRGHAKKLVVVIYAGSVVDLSEVREVADAVVLVGFGGQNVSQAAANVLTGKTNPSGKLTETWVASIDDVLAEHTYRDEKCMVYSDQLDVGYRYYETYDVDVVYPFGYGLSYSSFKYSDLKLEEKENKVTVTFQLENTSDIDGKEVAQVYVRECNPHVYRPLRELKAFKKVALKAHEKKEVTVELEARDFAYYSTGKDCWTVDAGTFAVEIGKNVHDIVLEGKVELTDVSL